MMNHGECPQNSKGRKEIELLAMIAFHLLYACIQKMQSIQKEHAVCFDIYHTGTGESLKYASDRNGAHFDLRQMVNECFFIIAAISYPWLISNSVNIMIFVRDSDSSEFSPELIVPVRSPIGLVVKNRPSLDESVFSEKLATAKISLV